MFTIRRLATLVGTVLVLSAAAVVQSVNASALVAPDFVDWGYVQVGTSVARDIIITVDDNTGLSSSMQYGDQGFGLRAQGCSGNSCYVTMVFHPGQLGVASDYLKVRQCGGEFGFDCGPEKQIHLVGTGAELTSGTMTASPTTVAPGASISAISVTPCPAEATSVQVSLLDGDGNVLATHGATRNSGGNWAGVVTVPLTAPAGAAFVTAQCSGNFHIQDYNYVAVTITSTPAAETTTALTSSVNPSSVSQPVTFTATVAAKSGGSTPSGAVTFTDGGTSLGTVNLSSGVARLTTSTLSVGSHSIIASYAGSSQPSSASLTQTVQKAATSLKAAPVKKTANATFSATLSTAWGPVANQTVSFTIPNGFGANKPMCSAITNASGVATCTASNAAVTLYFVNYYTATFAGSPSYLAASAKGSFA